jgi:chaperone required for assembly of F1-ATPase
VSAQRDRFYRDASVERNGEGYAVRLDGKAVKTPAGRPLQLPTRALAEAVAEEWRQQEKQIRPETMLLTKLANTAIDRIASDRSAVIAQIIGFARSDLVCYRAETPAVLNNRQAEAWDPLLAWLDTQYGARLETVEGIGFHAQSSDALAALERAVSERGDFALAGLHAAACLCGSAVIALALAERQIDALAAFAAAHVDETFQQERWGEDPEAAAEAHSKAAELAHIARFLSLLTD